MTKQTPQLPAVTTPSLWLTASQLAGCCSDVPSTKRRTQDWLEKASIPSRPRVGRGGGLEYDTRFLPPAVQAALATKNIAAHARKQSVAAEIAPKTTALSIPTPPPTPIAHSDKDKAVADARMALIRAVLDIEHAHGIKKAYQIVSLQIATNSSTQQLITAAALANQRPRKGQPSISPRALENWLSIYREQGWGGLLPTPAPAAPSLQLDDDMAQVLALYKTRDARFRKLSAAVKEVMYRNGQPLDAWQALYFRARRVLDKLGQSHEHHTALIKARNSGSDRDAKLPFKRRDAGMLDPLDVFVVDGHTFKAKVRHPDHGAPFAPELTMVLDWSTRLIVGWSVALSENVFAVGDALRHAVAAHGIPAIVYSDNGGGETAKALDCPIDGIMARLGIEHRTGIPGKPQARGVIERSWQTHAINLARKYGTYQGSDVDGGEYRKVAAELAKEQRAIKASEKTGAIVRLTNKLPAWTTFVADVERMVSEYNLTHRHRSLPKTADGKHMTPAEAWASKFKQELQHRPSPTEARELFMPAVIRTAARGEVRLFNQIYAANELMRRDVDGREVSVRYDIHDPTWVRIYTLDGAYVCDALWNANRIDAMPKAVVEMAREKRVKTAIKRREQQIDTALRELRPTVPAAAPLPLVEWADDIAAVTAPQPSETETEKEMQEPAPQREERPVFDTAGERYEWLMRHTDAWTTADQHWLNAYAASDEYTDLHDYYESRGLGYGNTSALKTNPNQHRRKIT
jgi:putative transposase